MQLVRTTFNERVSDIESYFELVKNIEIAISQSSATFNVNGGLYNITPDQQKIMYSGIYLHLYNLVEATMNMLIDALERNAQAALGGDVALLSESLRSLYVKSVTQPHDDALSYEAKLARSLSLFKQVLQIEPAIIKFPAGGGGNWDYAEIRKFSDSVGVRIVLPRNLNRLVQRPIRNEKAPLRLVKDVRNNLAHGSISFKDCGADHVSSDFRALIDIVKEYLSNVLDAYDLYITSGQFRQPVV